MTSHLQEQNSLRELFGELSLTHARRGDAPSAQLAAWVSDVHVLEQLLWRNGLGDAPDPEAQLATLGEAIAASLDALAADDPGELTARGALELAREAMVATFDESVRHLLEEGFVPLDHLDHLAAPDVTAGDQTPAPGRDRLGDRTPEQLVVELLAASGDCMAVARELEVEGEHAGAARMSHQADVASFEAYLVAAAALAGDHELASVELRWEAAHGLGTPACATTGDLGTATAARRRRLLGLLGSAEQVVLEQTFERVPETWR
jgi:hypothetical protein